MGARIIAQIHGGLFDRYALDNGRRRRAVVRSTLAQTDAVAVLSASWAERLAPVLARPPVVIRNAVEVATVPPTTHRGATVVHVGGTDPVKNLGVALRAVANLNRAGMSLRLVVIGRSDEETLRDLVQRSGIEPTAVDCRGSLANDEVRAVFRAAAVVLITSTVEGVPLAMLEAMAEGCVVLAFAVGGIPDTVRDGLTGTLVRPGDDTTFERRLRELVNDDTARTTQATQAHARVLTVHSAAVQAQRLTALYASVLRLPPEQTPVP